MVVFSLLAVLLFMFPNPGEATTWDMSKDPLDTAKWLCEHHTYAAEGTFSTEKGAAGTEAHYCKLTFDVDGPEKEWTELCEYMYPADFIDAKKDGDRITCNYEITYLCPAEKFPVGDVCVEFHEDEKTLAEAEYNCRKTGALLPSDTTPERFFFHILSAINPRQLGFTGRKYWLTGSPQNFHVILARGIDLNRPGKRKPAKGDDKANSFCLSTGMKTHQVFENECDVYKNQFKLAAQFYKGTCYIQSLSVFSEVDVARLHKHCQWFSDHDRVVSPLSDTRREGMDGAIAGTPFEHDYARTAIQKYKLDKKPWTNWMTVDGNGTRTTLFSGLWLPGRPKHSENDMEPRHIVYDQALAIPKAIRKGSPNHVLLDIPAYFRGHTVCGSGISAEDQVYKLCDNDWARLTRDDGRLMCIKAFTTELERKNYEQALNFCGTFGAVLAPMESSDEQSLIIQLMQDASPVKQGAMWLGGQRKDGGPFYWSIDGRQVVTANWETSTNEPNNIHNNEWCMQIYTGGVQGRDFGRWNDIRCDMTESPHGDEIKGGVCAKYV